MPIYRCYILDEANQIFTAANLEAEGDASALTKAAAKAKNVRIISSDRSVARTTDGRTSASARQQRLSGG